MKRLFPLFLLISFLAAPVSAQQPRCAIKLADAPELRGFRLGMTKEAADGIANQAERGQMIHMMWRADGYGSEHRTVFPQSDDFKGVDAILLAALDGKIARVHISYGKDAELFTHTEFAARVGRALQLPAAAWRTDRAKEFYEIQCEGFYVTVSRPSVTLAADGFDEAILRRKAEDEEKKRREFKP